MASVIDSCATFQRLNSCLFWKLPFMNRTRRYTLK